MDVVEVWEAEWDQDPNELTLAALDRTRRSTFRCIALSSTGDTLAVQVVGDDLSLPRFRGHGGYAASACERQSDSVSFGLL